MRYIHVAIYFLMRKPIFTSNHRIINEAQGDPITKGKGVSSSSAQSPFAFKQDVQISPLFLHWGLEPSIPNEVPFKRKTSGLKYLFVYPIDQLKDTPTVSFQGYLGSGIINNEYKGDDIPFPLQTEDPLKEKWKPKCWSQRPEVYTQHKY